MVYIVEGTSDCPCGFDPEVFSNVEKALEALFTYNEECGITTAFTMNRFESLDHYRVVEDYDGQVIDMTEAN